MNIPWYRKVIYYIIAPFIIGGWAIMHPRKVWEQAKIEWNNKGCGGDCYQGRRDCDCEDENGTS